MSSSLLPENITPAMTSIQPGRVPWNMRFPGETGWKGSLGLGAGQGSAGILRVFRGYPHIVADFWGFLSTPPEKCAAPRGFQPQTPTQSEWEQNPTDPSAGHAGQKG